MSFRVALVSDLHLTRRPSLFQYNWEIVVDMIRDWSPDLVVCAGDIAVDGPGSPDDLAYGKEQLGRLGVEVLSIPGNHDVGDAFIGHDPIEEAAMERYRSVFGPDHWVVERGGWVLVGLNAQVIGTGLAGEAEQMEALERAIADASGKPIAVFSHKTLHLGEPEAELPVGWTLPQPHATRLRTIMQDGGVRFYGSGHFHRYREIDDGGLRLLWAPSPAFLTNHPSFAARGGLSKVGFVCLELDPDGTFESRFAEDNAMVQFDIQNAITDGGKSRTRWSEKLSVNVVRKDQLVAAGAE